MPSATAVRRRETWSLSKASGGWGIWGFNSQTSFGFGTVAIGREPGTKELAIKLGAHSYIDAEAQDVSTELTALGGARVILATAPDGKAMGNLVDGLGVNGKLILIGVTPEPFPVSALQLLLARKSIQGWRSGTAKDCQDTLRFAAAHGVRPMIETFLLDRVADAYEHMLSGKARFFVRS